MRDSFVATMHRLLGADPDVMLLTGDLGFGIFDEIARDYPEQFINVGVAEQNMLGLSAGLSMMGKKVFCYSIANFSFMRGLEQFRNGAIYHNTNVTVVCSGGGFTYGQLGFTHFAIEDYGILSSFGSLKIHHPATSEQVVAATEACVNEHGPKYLRLEKAELNIPSVSGSAGNPGLQCHQEGRSTAIVVVGSLLQAAMDCVKNRNDDIAVYSMIRHDLIGDQAVLDKLSRYKEILTLEEHVLTNGLGQKLQAALPEVRIKALGISDQGPSIVGDQNHLRNLYDLTEAGIEKALGAVGGH